MEKQRNYIKLKNYIPWRESYLYIDTAEYIIHNVFNREKINVKFGSKFVKENSKYIIVLCSIAKRDRDRFILALNEVMNNMPLLGYPNYHEECEKIMNLFERKVSE